MRKEKGIILISVLVIVSIITMLVILGLTSSELEHKMSMNDYANLRKGLRIED